jgi:hypothetical protein
MKRLLPLILALCLVTALTSVPAQATVLPPGKDLSTKQILNLATGAHYGPNSYTYGGRGLITGFHHKLGTSVWTPIVTTSHPSLAGQMHPMGDWWNPFSWNWKAILGKLWTNVLEPCLKGASGGFAGGIASNKVGPFLMRGASVELTPYGYGLLAFGGCFATVYSQ